MILYRWTAAIGLAVLMLRCGPTEHGSPKPDGEPADSLGTLEVKAILPGTTFPRVSASNRMDTTLCEISRGGSFVTAGMLVPQPDLGYSGVFTQLPVAEDYIAAVFFWNQDGVTAAFGEKTGIRIEAGKRSTAIIDLASFKPRLIEPADASVVSDANPSFRWDPIQGAACYLLQAAMDSSFQFQYFSCEGLTGCEYTHGVSLGPWSVFWRVAARDRKGRAGLWSGTWNFSIGGGTGNFIVQGLGIRFGPYDPATQKAGDFMFLQGYTRLFWEFGLSVGDCQGGLKQLPDFGYLLPMDAWVTAVAYGRIVRAVYQEETQDWEFTAVSTADPGIQVGYDHLVEPRIRDGDIVAPGDTLGRPGIWDGVLGRVEVTIHDVPSGVFRCPIPYLDPAVSDSLAGLILGHMQDWETFTGDTSVYQQDKQLYPGCRVESIVVY